MCQWDQEEFVFPSYKNKSQQIIFHSALHAWQVYMQVNENKQNKLKYGALASNTFWQTCCLTLVPLPVYVDETDRSICFPLLKNKSQQIFFHSAPHACQVYRYASDNKQTKSQHGAIQHQIFVASSLLNSRAFICICRRDRPEFVFPSSQKKNSINLFPFCTGCMPNLYASIL